MLGHDKLTGAYVERWRQAQVHREKTAAQIETNLRRHVYPRLGERPMASVRQSEVQALVKGMLVGTEGQKPLAPGTVNTIYTGVATIFRVAVLDRVIVITPCRQIRLPKARRRSCRWQ